MNPPRPMPPQRVLDMLESLLQLPGGDLKATLNHIADLLADSTGADKVDAFLHDPERDSLVAIGTSTQPLSALERKHGLDVLPIANGGCTVQVYKTGKTFHTGHLEDEAEELRGVKDALGVRSTVGVALDVGGERRGLLLLCSQRADFFTPDDVRYLESIVGWVGVVVHRAELAEAIGRNAAEEGRRAGAEEMITVLAHDLRNYLAPLGLRLELLRLRAQQAGREDDVEDTGVAARSVTQLARLIADILDVARLDQGIFQMRLEPVDLGAMVREAASTLGRPGLPLKVTVEEGPPVMVSGDATRLRQCVDNLIANAVEKSPNRSVASVFVKREPGPSGRGRALVEVVDEGPGIPDDLLPRVFDRFVSGKSSQGGLGLGLYLAKRIARLHGGDLVAESKPGKGARFTLKLPAAA